MGKIVITISTILLVLAIGGRNTRKNKKFFREVINVIIEINIVYLKLFKDKLLIEK